jgi:hypothetical protein
VAANATISCRDIAYRVLKTGVEILAVAYGGRNFESDFRSE